MAQGLNQPFALGSTVTVAAGTTSANTLLPGNADSVLIYNGSSATAFVTFGVDLTVSPTSSSGFPIPPGGTQFLTCGQIVASAAVILASGSGNVYLSRGNGGIY